MTSEQLLEVLRSAAGGVAGKGRRLWQRRAHLHELAAVAGELARVDERTVRELARTLRSEASRALHRRRLSWLHVAVAGLALDLLHELAAPRTMEVSIVVDAQLPPLPPTARCVVCEAVIPNSRLMCFPHWSQLPRPVQRGLIRGKDADRPRLVLEAIAIVAKSRGRVPAWHVGTKPAEFFSRPTRRDDARPHHP